MQKIIQIYTCLLKLSRKQESVTDGRPLLLYPSPLLRGDNKRPIEEIFPRNSGKTNNYQKYQWRDK
jgi:hypothetical protein